MRRPSEPWFIATAGAALGLGLLGLVAWEGKARAEGTEVALAMGAVDPRSLLSGHYVALNLTETLGDGRPCPPGAGTGFDSQRRGWVALRRAGDRHQASGAAIRRSDAARLGELVVRGDLTCEFRGEAVTLHIGVERFHASQAEAESIERVLRRSGAGAQAFALVSVGRDGRARLNGVRIDGRRISLKWF